MNEGRQMAPARVAPVCCCRHCHVPLRNGGDAMSEEERIGSMTADHLREVTERFDEEGSDESTTT